MLLFAGLNVDSKNTMWAS